MGDYSNIGKGIQSLMETGCLLLLISLPLAAWKVLDIIIWACDHLRISWE